MADTVVLPNSSCMGIHNVGCVDLMHKDLLVRIFYPADADTLHPNYTKWLPSSTYAEGYINMMKALLPLLSLPPFDALMSKI